MLRSSWEAQRLAGDQPSGDIALQMAQRGQRKRAVQAQLGVRGSWTAGGVCVCVCVCVCVSERERGERGMYVCVCEGVLKE